MKDENYRDGNNSFIAKAMGKHGLTYDYSRVNYVNSKTKINVICKIHGVFAVTPTNHLHKMSGCPICGFQKRHPNSHFMDGEKTTKAKTILVDTPKSKWKAIGNVEVSTIQNIKVKVSNNIIIDGVPSNLNGVDLVVITDGVGVTTHCFNMRSISETLKVIHPYFRGQVNNFVGSIENWSIGAANK